MIEKWRKIPNFSRYEASTLGRLRSTNYKNSGKTKVLKPALNDGYFKTMLKHDTGKYKTWRVHKWVALTFLQPIDGKTEVNHINGIKTDNRPINLEYCTHSENITHAYKLGLQKPLTGENNPCSKITKDDVREIRLVASTGGRYYGRKLLAEKYNISEAHVKDIVNNRVWIGI